tara:strand:+ start:886 stop:1785 length:900 start_codon:yes stop_codon:yes gene_type:complete
MDRQVILLLEAQQSVSDNQLMLSYFLSYHNYHHQLYILKEILNRAESNKLIFNIKSTRGKNILMTIIRNIADFKQWRSSRPFLSLINVSLKVISMMSLEQLNYQFDNHSRVVTYSQDILESTQYNRPLPNSRTLNIDDNYTQDKIKPGDTSLIYALRLWPSTREIIWSLLQRKININIKSYRIWKCNLRQDNQIFYQDISKIPNDQIPIQIVWRHWQSLLIPQPYEINIYYKLLIASGGKNIPKEIIVDSLSSKPDTSLGKIYYQCHSRYLVKQSLIRQTTLPSELITSIFQKYLNWYN